ncbi:MFS transporter [Variovorax sp. WS11]|uniref:MFS transporter n=1 Tax=Variovorax sp. WS11 TaxID=1105204 RepID=UPI0013DD0622|nr:MFS transporter [Variovorax sp. WS11]NDZ17244.1 MFS transporter [Variovorax sp. WS11]
MKTPLANSASRLFATSPLRHPRFRLFYFGSLGTALGYTMQTTVAAWVMATLTPSEFMVALVQTASTAPALLFGLVAGALADIVDRRRLILATQWLLLASTAILGAATLAGLVGPAMLLALTFMVGAGLSLYLPAQAASIHDLVSREELPRAVALGAVAFNVARAVGPALAGGIAAWLGSGSALVASSLSFVLMIVAVYRMKKRERGLPGVPETVFMGVLSGLRFARHSLPMRSLLIRNVSFSLCASAFWALLPVIARDQLQLGAGGFGLLSAGFGIGAIVGALAIPGQLQRRSLNVVVTWASILWVGAIALLAATDVVALAIVAAGGGGAAWVSVLAGLSAGTQTSAPAWVRARAVSVNLVSMQASLALGSALWGAAAAAAGTRLALAGSVITMLLLLAISHRARVAMGNEADVTPGAKLAELAIATEPQPDDGPVLIQIEYRIDREHRAEFLRAIHAIEPARRRNGASSWRVFRDLGEDGLFVERFIIASWAEYVRTRARATIADRSLQERIERSQRAGVPVRISRLIGIDRERDVLGDETRHG